MAIHSGTLPRFRQAPQRRVAYEKRSSEGFSLARAIHLQRLNEFTADAPTRLRATSVFILGLTALVAAMAII
jgi:hypothetical protein